MSAWDGMLSDPDLKLLQLRVQKFSFLWKADAGDRRTAAPAVKSDEESAEYLKRECENSFWWLNNLMLGAKSSGGGRPWKERCRHLRNATILTSAALSLFSTAAREIHISNASRHTGVKGGSWRAGGLIWSSSRRPQFTPRPRLRSSPPHLSSTERGNKSDRVQSLSLICQWGEWAGRRLSDRPAVACPPCQLYWIMTRQEVACYEPREGRRRRHRSEISRAWFFPVCEATVRKSSRNETCLYVKFTMSFTR